MHDGLHVSPIFVATQANKNGRLNRYVKTNINFKANSCLSFFI